MKGPAKNMHTTVNVVTFEMVEVTSIVPESR